jgi:hypothetical protein
MLVLVMGNANLEIGAAFELGAAASVSHHLASFRQSLCHSSI